MRMQMKTSAQRGGVGKRVIRWQKEQNHELVKRGGGKRKDPSALRKRGSSIFRGAKGHLTFLAYFPRTNTFPRLRRASASMRNVRRPPASSGRPSADMHPSAPGVRAADAITRHGVHAHGHARTEKVRSLARPCFRRLAASNLPRYYRWQDRFVYASCCWICAAVPPPPAPPFVKVA